MKKQILVILLTISTYAVSFSQGYQTKFRELTQEKPTYEHQENVLDSLASAPITGLDNDTIYIKKFDNIDRYLDLKLDDYKLFRNQDKLNIISNTEPVYTLQIMKPTGNYPIQIYKPDSTKQYTVLIKDF
ncbi:hypothetical protein [Algoriphagus chordae]|uniref:Uncharacterized protein n=1 Tax=Algoriphagus chordae TaxID=237019 RepID=A0A2W7QVW5_9BACT|nr:hypothetical protein [Algoriphagus chordae]PZX47817.1 hypothetical protein LV85_03801 [Algoriphagus chordae]